MGETNLQQYRAIVLDDLDFCRDLLTDFLEDRGYQVICFPDVTACPLFPARNAECPQNKACADFLLTDNRMPHMAGIDFLELQDQGKCKIKAYAKAIFSAYWTPEELRKAEQLGCHSFHKPYDLALLGRWLTEQEKKIPSDRALVDLCNVMSPTNQVGTNLLR